MKSKIIVRIWAISLIIIGICSLIFGLSGIFDIPLPDYIRRIIGAADIILLPVLSFTSVKILANRRKD